MKARILVVLLPWVFPVLAAAELSFVGPEDRPVSGVEVRIYEPPAATDSTLGRLDARHFKGFSNGAGVVATSVPALDGLVLIADHPEFEPLIVELSEGMEPRFRLERGLSVGVSVDRTSPLGTVVATTCARWKVDLPAISRQEAFERCTDLEEEMATLRGLPDAVIVVEAQVPGFLPASREIEVVAHKETPLNFELDTGLRLWGHALEPSDRPVSGARIEAGNGAQCTTDEAGRFVVSVAALPARVEGAAEGHRGAAITVSEPERVEDLLIVLTRGERLRARIADSTGAPRPDSRLWTHSQTPSGGESTQPVRGAEIDPRHGAVEVDLPGPGHFRLKVRAPGWRVHTTAPFEVGAGETVDLGEVTVERGAALFGTVINTENEPLVGVSLRAVVSGLARVQSLHLGGSSKVSSDDRGEFVLGGLEAGHYRLELRHRSGPRRSVEVELSADEQRDLGVLTLGPGTELSGTVARRDGSPRAGVSVQLHPPAAEAAEPLYETTVDSLGRMVPFAVAPGSYRVEVHGSRILLAQQVVVPEAPSHELELEVEGTRLSGVVTYRGQPVDGGSLRLSEERDPAQRRGKVLVRSNGNRVLLGTSDAALETQVGGDGGYRFDDAPAGYLKAVYTADSGQESRREIVVPDAVEARVDLEVSGIELVGWTRDVSTGEPISAEVEVFGDGPAGRTRSGEDGWFELTELPPSGNLAAQVSAEGYRSKVFRALETGVGSDPLLFELDPGADGGIVIRLRHSDGRPATWVPLVLLDGAGRQIRALPTDSSGGLELEDLAAGVYRIVWSEPTAGVGVSGPLNVRPGAVTEIEMSLDQGVEILLACQPAVCAGTAIDGLAIYGAGGHDIADLLSGVRPAMRFSIDGLLPLGRLAPGSYFVRAVRAGNLIEESILVDGAEHILSLP